MAKNPYFDETPLTVEEINQLDVLLFRYRHENEHKMNAKEYAAFVNASIFLVSMGQ